MALALLNVIYQGLLVVLTGFGFGFMGMSNAQALLFVAGCSLLPSLVATGVSVWAIVRSRPRWLGIVAVVLCAVPLVVIFVVVLYMVGLLLAATTSAA
ncbi:hypothetical protein [Microbacterium sp. NPDC056052]|uniref:hypothetical protein n=1 Tax=Microbacterium sp. NPDC056052 TaxID=3345695 RepID=UPI0035DBA8FF